MDNDRFKRTLFGGFNRGDVVEAFSNVSQQYAAKLDELTAQLSAAERERTEVLRRNSMLNAKVSELERINTDLRRQINLLEDLINALASANIELARATPAAIKAELYSAVSQVRESYEHQANVAPEQTAFEVDTPEPKPEVSEAEQAKAPPVEIEMSNDSETAPSGEDEAVQPEPIPDISEKTPSPEDVEEREPPTPPVSAHKLEDKLDMQRIDQLLLSIKPNLTKSGDK